jgi:hypothetical protein
MIDVCAKVLKGRLDARLRDFELAILSERGLSLNLDFGSVAHQSRASTRDGADKQPASVPLGIVCPKLAGSVFEPAKNLDALLVGVLVGDARSQRLHVVDSRDTSVDES